MMAGRCIGLIVASLFLSRLPQIRCLAPVEAYGSKFYNQVTGEQFFIRGVVYSFADELDILANGAQCKLDAALMETLGVNTIRVYSTDYMNDHDVCMDHFDAAGIYVLLGLDKPRSSINRLDPEWTMNLFDTFAKTLDVFGQYNNLLAVTVGNEIISDRESLNAAPVIKAAIRDLKAYRDGQGYRKIPIGYIAADDEEVRLVTQEYMVCGSEFADNAEFYGINRYSWCGDATFESSGYSDLYDESKNYSVPIFIAETGCDQSTKREFHDQKAILGPQMNDKWSGSIIYEWVEQVNEYGIIYYESIETSTVFSGTGTSAALTPTPISPDFYGLQSQWNTLTPTGIAKLEYEPTYSLISCSALATSGFSAATAPLPTIANLVITTVPSASTSGAASTINIEDAPSLPAVPANEAATTTSDGGLPLGTKITIGVVVPFLVLALAASIAFIFWRRRRRAKTAADAGPDYSEVTQNGHNEFYKPHGAEADGNPVLQLHAEDATQELGSRMVHQMADQEGRPLELDAGSGPYELSNGLDSRRMSRNVG
ncbi:MAG: hypothetical protein Q9172_000457 [Xanthocarpia lactea]